MSRHTCNEWTCEWERTNTHRYSRRLLRLALRPGWLANNKHTHIWLHRLAGMTLVHGETSDETNKKA